MCARPPFIGDTNFKQFQIYPKTIETRKYHRGASVPKQIWPLPGIKYHCQRTKNRDFQQLTRVQ